MKLVGRLVENASLTYDDRRQMLALMARHYACVNPEVFEADLREKQWVIQVRQEGKDELCGFSTQMVLDVSVGDRRIKALFSGDTIVDQDHWGDPALIQVGGELALSLAQRWPDEDLYWFLISQGYKTYRFLPLFFHEFYPRYDMPTPERAQSILDELAKAKFPERYDPVSGVVRAGATEYQLREGVADATAERCRDPHVQFFVDRNPGHVYGDELCCIALISRVNFTPAAYRVLGRRSSVY